MHGNPERSGTVHDSARRRPGSFAFRLARRLRSSDSMRAAAFVLLLAGCVTPNEEAPSSHIVPLDRAPSAALDGRPTFALAGRGDARYVSVIETSRATLAVGDDGTLVDLGGREPRAIARDVMPELAASADGRVIAFAVRTADAVADVQVLDGGRVRRLTEGLPAVVVAVSPRGDEVAFLAAATGLPALWTVTVAGDAAPRQLTNADLVRVPGRAPVGFVPPPIRASGVTWSDGGIAWEAGDGRWRLDPVTGEVLERP